MPAKKSKGETPENEPQPQDDVTSGEGGQDEPDIDSLPDWAQTLLKEQQERISQVNNEAATRRHELKAMQEQFEALKKAQEERLSESGQYKELAQQYKSQLEALQPYKTQAEQLEEAIRQSNEARISELPEQWRDVVPVGMPPVELRNWLDKNSQKFMRRPQGDIGAGAGTPGGTAKKRVLTQDERDIARRMGLTDEQYIAAQEKVEKSRKGE